MQYECPKCKTILEFKVEKTILKRESKPWVIASKETCPECRFRIGLETFKTENEAKKYLTELPALSSTG